MELQSHDISGVWYFACPTGNPHLHSMLCFLGHVKPQKSWKSYSLFEKNQNKIKKLKQNTKTQNQLNNPNKTRHHPPPHTSPYLIEMRPWLRLRLFVLGQQFLLFLTHRRCTRDACMASFNGSVLSRISIAQILCSLKILTHYFLYAPFFFPSKSWYQKL